MSTAVVIDVRDLRKSYGATRALDGLSFTVEAGEVFGIFIGLGLRFFRWEQR
ncbi:MAG: hypothetical protein HYY30_08920 [Chloroflexi bacterium]|nr:hypothetical protein [Chloroflexota bacterium]